MTAWVDDLDQPVAYWLTDAGWAVTGPSTLTLSEAATSSELAPAYVARLVRLGYVDGVEVDGQWLVDGASLAAFMVGRVPAAPLLRQVLLRGGDAACGVRQHSAEERALARARKWGYLTEAGADKLSCSVLRMSVWELWPSYAA